jgi:hypothetical protein
MPFDFDKMEHYSVDYDHLFEEINKQKILDNKVVQSHYLNHWRNALEKKDGEITKKLSTPKGIMDLSLFMKNEPELFQIKVDYKKTKVLLNFKVSKAKKITSDAISHSLHIPLSNFIGKDSNIYWNPVSSDVDFCNTVRDPILMVPYLSNQYNDLVIDGNHRLTYKTSKKIDDIRALIIAERTVIDHNLLFTDFDLMYYIMQNEINRIWYATNEKGAKAMNIVQKSYISDGVYKF